MRKILKQTSIRGRMAIGIFCLEETLKKENINASLLSELLDKLKSFTSSNQLDKWDSLINEYDPITILDTHPDNKLDDYDFLDSKKAVDLKNLYSNINKAILEMISDVIEIGTANLYGGTGQFSEYSLTPLLKVIKDSTNNEPVKINIEKIAYSSPFNQENGWGKPFYYNNLINDLGASSRVMK